MFNNVLVGVDGTANGHDAIALARRLMDPSGQMTLAHVHRGLLRLSAAATLKPAYEDALASQQLLERERAAFGIGADLVSVTAMSPGRGLHEEAERRNADLIVVGSSNRGLLGRVFVGDDARASLNGAPCAVAVAARSYAQQQIPLGTIGVGYDETPESEAALASARYIAAANGAQVHLLEAVSPPLFVFDGLVPVVDGLIEALVADAGTRLAALSDVDSHAVHGYAGEELAIFSSQVDLLVVGSRGYGPARRLVLGSTSNYLERYARCSLLVIPRPSASDPAGQRASGAQSEAGV